MHTGNQEEANKKVFFYKQDEGWKEYTYVPPLPWPDGSYHWHLSASGDDKYLIVADDSKLFIFDGHQWQQRDGPERDNLRILTHCGILYLIIRANHRGSFCKVPVQSLLIENDYDWENLMLKLPYVSDSDNIISLTLVGDHVTMVASIYTYSGRTLCVLSLSSTSDSWIGLTQLNLDHYSIQPSILGFPNGTLLLMGLIKVKDPPRSQNPSSALALSQLFSQAMLQFKMIELAPNGMLPCKSII